MGRPRALGENLKELLGADRLERLGRLSRLRRGWPAIVGPMLAARSEPVALDDHVLTVAVDHPAMAQHVRILQAEIVRACRRTGRAPSLRRVITRIQADCGTKPPPPSSPRRVPSLAEKKAVAREISGVRHKPLRRAMFKARLAQLAHAAPPER